MTDLLHRTFAPELEIRSTAAGGDGRTIYGLAVPYGQPQRINSQLVEQFARGAFKQQLRDAARIPFARNHLTLGGTLIGRTVELRDDPAGLVGAWQVSRTAAGDETLELVRDGALTDLSIAFLERQSRRLPDGTMERTKAELKEVAVVLEGAYGQAATVAGVRSHQEPSRLDEARRLLADLPVLPLP